MVDFVQIHNHSQFSKFDGFSSIDSLKTRAKGLEITVEQAKAQGLSEGMVEKAKRLGMPAIGLTDHGTVAGAIKFMKECRSQGIKPIVGCEMYLSRNHKSKSEKEQPDKRKGNRHLNVIAKDFKGMQNLFSLSQVSFVEGYYYDPRIDFELLSKHREGLIVTSACLSSVINANLYRDRYAQAKAAVSQFKDIFGDDFYLEAMYHGIDAEGKILPDIQKLGREMDVKIIGTNDSHYTEKSDAEFQRTLTCIQSGKTIKDPSRYNFPYDEFYLKSYEEMYQIFGHVPSFLTNTLEVAEKCDYSDLVFVEDGGPLRLPNFDLPDGFTSPHDYLEHLGWEGMKRLGYDKSKPHMERYKKEIGDIRLVWETNQYDFATYFLIVFDIIRFAREKKIACGIRGSGYGSLLLKCLGLTEGIDPLGADLLWERFLGFSSRVFIQDSDFGIRSEDDVQAVAKSEVEDVSNPTEIMFERYG